MKSIEPWRTLTSLPWPLPGSSGFGPHQYRLRANKVHYFSAAFWRVCSGALWRRGGKGPKCIKRPRAWPEIESQESASSRAMIDDEAELGFIEVVPGLFLTSRMNERLSVCGIRHPSGPIFIITYSRKAIMLVQFLPLSICKLGC